MSIGVIQNNQINRNAYDQTLKNYIFIYCKINQLLLIVQITINVFNIIFSEFQDVHQTNTEKTVLNLVLRTVSRVAVTL